MIELIYGVWFIKGGMFQYAKALEKRFIELGGKIVYNSTVEKIIVENNKHVSGLLINNTLKKCDAVVANADFPYTMTHLLDMDDNKKGKYQKKNIEKMDYSMSCFLLYLGLDNNYDQLNLHTIKMANNFETNVYDIDNGILPDDPSFYIYNPSAIDNSFAPSGQSALYVLVPVSNLKENSNWSENDIDKFTHKIIHKVETELNLDNLNEHIVFKKAHTPKTFETYYNSFYGATFGLKPTLKQSNYFRPHNKHAKIDNLYFAGASVHPGAGVPIVITSGELTAKEVMRDF